MAEEKKPDCCDEHAPRDCRQATPDAEAIDAIQLLCQQYADPRSNTGAHALARAVLRIIDAARPSPPD